jgi:hypothetical protein
MPLTLDQISEYLRKAAEQAGQVKQEASDKKIGEKVLDEIAAQSEAIQSGINKLLGNIGIVTEKQLDEIDEQLRIQKEKLLSEESKKTKRNLITYSVLGIATIGLLWFLTKKK